MYQLTKNFRFETAHRLAKGYVGKCANIHGHSWNGSIAVSVKELDEFGFAVDYKDLGKFTKMIEDTVDHKIMLWKGDQEIIDLCADQGWQFVIFEGNPTCESVAKWIFEAATQYFKKEFGERVAIDHVIIHETCTTGCTYNPNKL